MWHLVGPQLYPFEAPSRRELRRKDYRRYTIGPIYSGDGPVKDATGRQSKDNSAVVQQGAGKYQEDSTRGNIAFACDIAGVAITTSISTTSILSLYNPATSKTRISILVVSLGYFSGTLGAGTIYHCVNPIISGTANPTAPTSGALLTSYFSDIMNPQLGTPQGIVRTASSVVAPVGYRPFCSTNAILASSATGIYQIKDDMDGEITLEPGGIYQLQARMPAAGSSPLMSPGIVWKEIPFAASLG